MKKIITILGDSLSMARDDYGILYKDSYAYLLGEILGDNYLVLNKAKRANTMITQTHFQNIYDDVLTTNSEYFIIQLGIVDCAPRIISIMEGKILKYLKPKILSDLYIKIKSRNRRFFTKYFPKTYVKPDVFVDKYDYLIRTILEKTTAKKVILVNIADTNKKNKLRSYGFDENIRKYNSFIGGLKSRYDKHIELIDLYTVTKNNPDLVIDDGIHIAQPVHKLLAEKIATMIKSHNA